MSTRPARTKARGKKTGSPPKKPGRLPTAIVVLAAAVLVLPTAPALIKALDLHLDTDGQRVVKILTVVVAVIAFFIALHDFVEKHGESWSPRNRKLFVLSAVAAATGLLVVLATFNDPFANVPHMTGTQDVATLAFVRPDGSRTQPLEDLSIELAQELAEQLPAGTAESYAGVEAPLHRLLGPESAELGRWAAEFADRSGADLIFGGVVDDQSGPQIRVRPAIYISPGLVPEAMELSGWTVGPWLPVAGGVDSRRGRDSVLRAFLHDGLAIARFVDALDAWRVGDLGEADRLFRSIPTESQGLLAVDMLRLFQGHARQLVALGTDTPDRRDLLASAAADYRSIPPSSPIAARARLSLAANEYHQSSGENCSPGKVNPKGLEHAAAELRGLVAHPNQSPAAHLAALVHLAQAQACMLRARMPLDDAELTTVLAQIRAFEILEDNLRPIASRAQALGRAIEADQARRAGHLDQALDLIHQAISLSAQPRDLGQWWGLASIWEARRCNDTAARSALRQAIEQYGLAVSQGRMKVESLRHFTDIATTDLDREKERCRSRESHPSR